VYIADSWEVDVDVDVDVGSISACCDRGATTTKEVVIDGAKAKTTNINIKADVSIIFE